MVATKIKTVQSSAKTNKPAAKSTPAAHPVQSNTQELLTADKVDLFQDKERAAQFSLALLAAIQPVLEQYGVAATSSGATVYSDRIITNWEVHALPKTVTPVRSVEIGKSYDCFIAGGWTTCTVTKVHANQNSARISLNLGDRERILTVPFARLRTFTGERVLSTHRRSKTVDWSTVKPGTKIEAFANGDWWYANFRKVIDESHISVAWLDEDGKPFDTATIDMTEAVLASAK